MSGAVEHLRCPSAPNHDPTVRGGTAMAEEHSTKRQNHRLIDETGHRYGRLLVTGRAPSRGSRSRAHWFCLCDCGSSVDVEACNLRQGRQVSCGCHRAEVTTARSLRHGHARRDCETAEFKVWMGIIKRCCNVKDHNYMKYGARGITICDAWRHDYPAFLRAVGRRPTPEHSIERIDNGGNYEYGNVRWATRKEQGRNKRNNRLITFNGETKPVSQWAEEMGIQSKLIYGRLYKGWSPDRALTESVRRWV